jgi:catechol 2,3-dioxygenase-like lactoylglutathione lyase family enzyme
MPEVFGYFPSARNIVNFFNTGFNMRFTAGIFALASLFAIPSTCTVTMGAVGIAVSDLQKSQDFYTKTLGLKATGMEFDTPQFFEIIMKLPGANTGSALVLMKWKTPKQTSNLPVKLVFYVDNVKTTIDKMRGLGAKIVAEPGSLKLKNATIPTAFALDPDGYSIELNPVTLLVASN